jgi:hypothetical protein
MSKTQTWTIKELKTDAKGRKEGIFHFLYLLKEF